MRPTTTDLPPAIRLPYKKPALQSISLVADQALGTNCKGPNSNESPNFGGLPQGCFTKLCKNRLGS